MTTAKTPAFIGLYLELLFRGDQLLVGEIKFGGGSLLGGMSKFSAGRRGTPPPFAPVRKMLSSWGWGLRLEFPEVSQKQHVKFPAIN